MIPSQEAFATAKASCSVLKVFHFFTHTPSVLQNPPYFWIKLFKILFSFPEFRQKRLTSA